jgi:hypothetical protein
MPQVRVPLLEIPPVFNELIVPVTSVGQSSLQLVPLYMFIQPLVVLKIIKPATGEAMALRSAVVILGGKNPCVVDRTSSFADASGVPVPIPTCAKTIEGNPKRHKKIILIEYKL